jgi:multiple sugar transport system substrate-binding protein
MYGAYTSGLFTSQGSVFGIGSTGGAGYQWSENFETGIAQLPQNPNGKKAVISQGPSICMLSKDNAQEEVAAWLFLKFITTDAASQAKFAQASGYIPVTTSAQNAPEYKKYLEAASGTSQDGCRALAAKVAVEQSDKYFTSPTFVGSSQARDEVGNIIVNVLKGTAVQAAFDQAVQNCIEAVS